ncbi:ATP-binding cassette domain-containing protein [Thalassospira sp. ER-Se-21-Dark]|uniref:ATP-binding cassette domain-containing protein n=1 Tax=Thalassospira sp. ER-Se-21-Dark TaxID=2585190 RepID=UPI001B316FF4|nr:ATP-binding cassette domain-containing protein [Thalassospira sp. ER-Se-21-Dark]MBP3126854.1 ATP-binding cassette domain-containing protein [Thalassospira sp. ER-Se-21-Dark]
MPEAAKNGLELHDVRVRLDGRELVAVDMTIAPGEIVTLMGPSGSGKSSLLGHICGTLPDAFEVTGQVVLDGRLLDGLAPQDRHVGILFQDDLLFPHLSVGGNLAFALPLHIKGRAARRARVEAALGSAEMDGFYDRDPATLSGGQRARVALMRVLLSEPCALLLDEPFSKLDSGLRSQFRSFVFDLCRKNSLPTLMVTHDPEDGAAAGGRVIELRG